MVVVPSVIYKDYEEPLANSCLEGMAAGVPVIASGIGGLNDFIEDRVNGLLVPQNNPEKLAKQSLLSQKFRGTADSCHEFQFCYKDKSENVGRPCLS